MSENENETKIKFIFFGNIYKPTIIAHFQQHYREGF
jgi:hypothetical protein